MHLEVNNIISRSNFYGCSTGIGRSPIDGKEGRKRGGKQKQTGGRPARLSTARTAHSIVLLYGPASIARR